MAGADEPRSGDDGDRHGRGEQDERGGGRGPPRPDP